MRLSTMLVMYTCATILSGAAFCRTPERTLYAPPDDQTQCRGGFLPHEGPHFGLARVNVDKTHFIRDWDKECPQAASCSEKAYLVKGDLVTTAHSYGSWTCSAYPKGGYTEWLKTSDLVPMPIDPHPALKAWSGTWVNGVGSGFNSIKLSSGKTAGTLAVDGNACWGKDCEHSGSIVATGKPDGNAAMFNDGGECNVSMVLLGDYLVATDNDQCGGMNVSFSDVYWKRGSLGKPAK